MHPIARFLFCLFFVYFSIINGSLDSDWIICCLSPEFNGDPGDSFMNYVIPLNTEQHAYDFLQGFLQLLDVGEKTKVFRVVEPYSLVSPIDKSQKLLCRTLLDFKGLHTSKGDVYTDLPAWTNLNHFEYSQDMTLVDFRKYVIYLKLTPKKEARITF